MPDHKYAREFIAMMGAEFFKRRRFDGLLKKFAGFENGTMNPSAGFINKVELKGTAMGIASYMSGLALLATGNNEANRSWERCWSKPRRDTLDQGALEQLKLCQVFPSILSKISAWFSFCSDSIFPVQLWRR